MSDQSNYELAAALLHFKGAWKALTKASIPAQEIDLTYLYPFHLLDFEKIEPAVSQWCTVHAAELLNNLPDKVDNPACAKCYYFRCGVAPNGICYGADAERCGLYPLVPFSREIAKPFMLIHNSELKISDLADTELQLLYMSKMEELYERTKKKTTKSPEENKTDATSYTNLHIDPKFVNYDFRQEPEREHIKTEKPAVINSDAHWDETGDSVPILATAIKKPVREGHKR